MKKVKFGNTGPDVSRFGLGCMGMSGMYGPSDRAESIATIHAGSALGALLRLEQLILEVAVHPPRALIAEAVNVVIHIAGRGRKRHVETISRVVGFDGEGYRLADALEAPFSELPPVPLAAAAAAPSSIPDQPGELP